MLLTILLFFFVGNLHHSMVEGMMNHHVIYPPHNDGNQHITLNLNDEDETIEFSPTEVSYMLIISADIRSKEMLGDKETQTYKKIQKILSEKQANFVEEEKQKKSDVISDQIIKCLEDKRIKLCNYYETIIKESLIEKNITQDVPSLNKRLQQIKSFDPKRAQQLSDDYNKVNDSR
uniref:DUF148 domain-containing protein n=1 Tax=Meloidogyne hapla TaxID=6305 RepID=A0A1I8BVC3_MELHA